MRLVLKTCIQTTVVGMSRQVDDNDQIIMPTKCHRSLTSNIETQDLCSIYTFSSSLMESFKKIPSSFSKFGSENLRLLVHSASLDT